MAETPEKALASEPADGAVDDELLVRKFNHGDNTAFDTIVQKYSPDIAALANRLLGWPRDVEDVLQDIFLAAFLGLRKFRCKCTLKTWLFTITINKCRSYRYKQMLQRRFFSKAVDKIGFNPAPATDKTSMDREIFAAVRRAILALPPKYREPIVLRYLQQLPTDQISQILGISRNVLQVRLNRARKRLKKRLAQLIEE